MTSNGVTAFILRYFTKLGRYGANYISVVEVKLILSAIKMYPRDSALLRTRASLLIHDPPHYFTIPVVQHYAAISATAELLLQFKLMHLDIDNRFTYNRFLSFLN